MDILMDTCIEFCDAGRYYRLRAVVSHRLIRGFGGEFCKLKRACVGMGA